MDNKFNDIRITKIRKHTYPEGGYEVELETVEGFTPKKHLTREQQELRRKSSYWCDCLEAKRRFKRETLQFHEIDGMVRVLVNKSGQCVHCGYQAFYFNSGAKSGRG